ncbi:MAG TPA: MBL fold metallo-hydrolase [Vicinamibacterales bacterium]|nr:MBL fold metallo-hydrolase [Vicinamibacterales bacterium]
MPIDLNRRALLQGLAGTCVAAVWPRIAWPQGRRTRLILLGTGGGPRPRKNSSASAQVIIIDDSAYVIDCGDGVARQLASSGVSLSAVRHVFLTHHHSDHNADYGNLLLLGWASGLNTRVDTWGPPPLEKMTRLFLEMNAYDIETRIADEGRPALAPLVHAHELTEAGTVMQDDKVKVTAALVPHPLVSPAFAFRFDTVDRSIVISGDTARSDSLVALARGADVLVHEAIFPAAIDRLAARLPHAKRLRQHLVDSHTSAEDCGRVAEAAGVKTLVLSHLVPPDDPAITDAMWIDAARAHFRGTVILGKDLLEI